MFQAVELKVGTIFVYTNEPYKVLEYKHTHMARGSADVRLKIRGLISGIVIPVVFAPSDRFQEANLQKKKMQYLYVQDDQLMFMDPQSYEQIEIAKSMMGDMAEFLQDAQEYDVLYWDDKALDILVPPKVDLKVVECDPGIKGNSAANMYKSATLEGGITIKVPLFIKTGEKVRIDTVNRKYVERAK